MRLVFIKDAEKCPHREGHGEGEHDVRNQNAGEKKQANTSGHDQASVESRTSPECPNAHGRGKPAKSHRRQRNGDARRPIVSAKDFVGDGDRPINERRFLQIRNAVEMSGHPVAGSQHVASDLRLHRIHIIRERGRRNNAPDKNHGREENDDVLAGIAQAVAERLTSLLPAASRSNRVCMFHRLIHKNKVSKPHRWYPRLSCRSRCRLITECTPSQWKICVCFTARSVSVSSNSGFSTPRNQSCVGMSNPTFFLRTIAGGSFSFISSLSKNFICVPRSL